MQGARKVFAWMMASVVVITGTAVAGEEVPRLTLSQVRGNVYVAVDDYPLSDENSAVYIGPHYVTVIGATFSPATAQALAAELRR